MTLDLLMSSINFGDTSPRVANNRKRKTFGTGFRRSGGPLTLCCGLKKVWAIPTEFFR
jgi:hypothetical protein